MSTALPPQMIRNVEERAQCLYTQEEVEKALDEMAHRIHNDLSESSPIVLCVMVGGLVPTGMLLDRLNFPLQVDYVHATRYGLEMSGKSLEWLVKPHSSLKDRVVLIVDDILDGGETLAEIIKFCYEEGAKSVKTAVLVNKNRERTSHAVQKADYSAVCIDDLFVYGLGMDYKRYLRNAPGIYAVAEEDK